MSNLASALQGKAQADVRDMGLTGMITVRGDLGDVALRDALVGVTGVSWPGQRGIATVGSHALAWMSPDEALVLCDHDRADQIVETISAHVAGSHHLAVNVSDARALFQVTGAWRDTLARLTPADLRDFGPGVMCRSRLAQVPAAFWVAPDGSLRVVCFRSVAQYVFDLLANTAEAGRL